MLPLLELRVLSSLACACKAFRELVRVEERVWRSAAAAALPLQPSALSGLSCASIRAILQRRAEAKRNIADNRVGTTLQLVKLDRKPAHIMFSPPGHDRIAVVLATGELTMFATQDGMLLWTISLLPFVADFKELELRGRTDWHHGQTLLKLCVGPTDWANEHDICLRIISFDTDTGSLRTRQSLSLAGMEFSKVTGCNPSFFHSGRLVSVLISRQQPDSASHLVVDAETCTALLSHNFEGNYPSVGPPSRPRPSWFRSTWSQDGRIVAAMGQLVHVQDSRRLSLFGKVGDADDDVVMIKQKFHPSGHLLGWTCFRRPTNVPSTTFVDTATGVVLCCIGGCRFVDFLSKADHALLLSEDQRDRPPDLQQYTVFDCSKQARLRNVACSASFWPPLAIALDDGVVLGYDNFSCGANCLLFCCLSAAGNALHYHAAGEVWQWHLSSDETSLAICAEAYEESQRCFVLSLVKL